MSNNRQGELFRTFMGGKTPPMSRDTQREIELGCSSLSATRVERTGRKGACDSASGGVQSDEGGAHRGLR
jgi:hypothetical protein